jgi:hypothetical protein
MPDAGEWLCVEMDGVAYCKSEGEAAGVERGAADPGFVCGARRGHGDERICVDLSPDAPPESSAFRCRFSYATGRAERVCKPSDAPLIGARCAGGAPCPEAAWCVAGVCLPPRPEPACWLDADCGEGQRCRWGSCLALLPRKP